LERALQPALKNLGFAAAHGFSKPQGFAISMKRTQGLRLEGAGGASASFAAFNIPLFSIYTQSVIVCMPRQRFLSNAGEASFYIE
jgi:hypothetical protein